MPLSTNSNWSGNYGNSTLQGAGTIVKQGPGNLVLTSAAVDDNQSYALDIQQGTVSCTVNTALPANIILDGGTLRIAGALANLDRNKYSVWTLKSAGILDAPLGDGVTGNMTGIVFNGGTAAAPSPWPRSVWRIHGGRGAHRRDVLQQRRRLRRAP